MPAILVVAHTPLASSLQAVATHVYPDCARQMASVDVDAGASPEQIADDIRTALAGLGGEEALILADMYGATPCNVARSVADGVHVRVVAGVNVPMLWRTLCYATMTLDELERRAIDGGTQGVKQVLPEPRSQK